MMLGRRCNLIMSCLLFFIAGHSQSFLEKSHLGLGLGAMKYMGDIRSPYTKFAIQGTYTYELTNHINIRGQVFFGSVGASDAGTPPYLNEWLDADQINRNPNARPHPFNSRIEEASVMGEYNLFDMNEGSKWTPYGFLGVGYFHYTPYYTVYDNDQNRYLNIKYNLDHVPRKFNIPFGGGIKYGLTDNIRLFGELDFRYTTTDYIDGLSATGSSKANDYYYSFLIGVTFRLGGDYSKKTKNGSGGRSSSRKDCPPVYL